MGHFLFWRIIGTYLVFVDHLPFWSIISNYLFSSLIIKLSIGSKTRYIYAVWQIFLSPQFWRKSGSITARSEFAQNLVSMEIQPTTNNNHFMLSCHVLTIIQSWVNNQWVIFQSILPCNLHKSIYNYTIP